MRDKFGFTILVPALGLLFAGKLLAASENDLAVVTGKAGDTALVSSNDLKQIFLGERTRWPDGHKMIVVTLGPARPEFAGMLRGIYRMNDNDFRRYFLRADFTGKNLTPPRQIDSPAALKAFVSRTPGSIGCIRSTDVDDSVKVLQVDGALPGTEKYKLQIPPH